MKRVIKKYLVPHKGNDFRPHFLRMAGIIVLLALIIGAFFGSQVQRFAVSLNDYLANVLPAVLVDLANEGRSASALNTLTVSPALEEAARMKAEDMAAKGYFAHTSPEGVSPWYWFSKAGYAFAYAGENLAIQFDDSAAVNAAWMASPSHRANILNDRFTEVGIATAKGVYEGRETMFVVEMFGRPIQKLAALETSVAPATVIVSNPSVRNGTEVAGSDISVRPLASSSILSDTASQTFIAVENAEAVASPSQAAVASGAHSARYASAFERFVTSPTKTLAIAYLAISVLLLAILLPVLFIEHNRRVRHALIILALFALLCGIFYAYRAFVHSEVRVLASLVSSITC